MRHLARADSWGRRASWIVVLVLAPLTGGFFAAGWKFWFDAIAVRQENRLECATGVFAADVDTLRLPVVNLTFARRALHVYVVGLTNAGTRTQSDVHVRLSRAGSLQWVSGDNRYSVRDPAGEVLADFDEFEGEDELRFVIPSLPPGETFALTVWAYPDSRDGLARLGIQSASASATLCPLGERTRDKVLAVFEHEAMRRLKPGPVRALEWP